MCAFERPACHQPPTVLQDYAWRRVGCTQHLPRDAAATPGAACRLQLCLDIVTHGLTLCARCHCWWLGGHVRLLATRPLQLPCCSRAGSCAPAAWLTLACPSCRNRRTSCHGTPHTCFCGSRGRSRPSDLDRYLLLQPEPSFMPRPLLPDPAAMEVHGGVAALLTSPSRRTRPRLLFCMLPEMWQMLFVACVYVPHTGAAVETVPGHLSTFVCASESESRTHKTKGRVLGGSAAAPVV